MSLISLVVTAIVDRKSETNCMSNNSSLKDSPQQASECKKYNVHQQRKYTHSCDARTSLCDNGLGLGPAALVAQASEEQRLVRSSRLVLAGCVERVDHGGECRAAAARRAARAHGHHLLRWGYRHVAGGYCGAAVSQLLLQWSVALLPLVPQTVTHTHTRVDTSLVNTLSLHSHLFCLASVLSRNFCAYKICL